MFLASVLGLKNECFCSNSEAVSPSPGLQPPPLMLSPPPQNNTDPLDMETHSHPCTYNSHTCIHTKCSYTPAHTQITYSHTQAYTHSHVVIHSNHIYMAHNSLAHTHTHRISPALTEKIHRLVRLLMLQRNLRGSLVQQLRMHLAQTQADPWLMGLPYCDFKRCCGSEFLLGISQFKNTGLDSPGGPVVENVPVSTGDMGLTPGPGRLYMPRGNSAHMPQVLKPACGKY